MKTALSFVLGLLVSFSDVGQGLVSNSATQKAIAELKEGHIDSLRMDNFGAAPRASSLDLLRMSATLPDSVPRSVLIPFALGLYYKEDPKKESQAAGPDDKELARALITVLGQDKHDDARECAARELLLRFSWEDLSAFSSEIQAAAVETRGRRLFSLVLLYATNPASEPGNVRQYLQSYETVKSASLDAARAYNGDNAAEGRLLQNIQSTKASCITEMEELVRALAVARTPKIQYEISLGLRNEDLVTLSNGCGVPKRNYYGEALFFMMRHRADFPFKTLPFPTFSDASLDALEKWCTQHIGISYPNRPRKAFKEGAPRGCFE